MLQQYLRLKEEYPQTLLFFRLGDFYELFNDDALIASRELEIVLTGRDAGKNLRMPMCGVPYHAATQYIGRLLNKGYRVALAEQVEDPKSAKGLVARDVVRVYTPGTVIEDGLLPNKAHNYLTGLAEHGGSFGLATVDLSTGEFSLTEVNDLTLVLDELARLNPAEIILPEAGCLPSEYARQTVIANELFASPHEALAVLADQYELAAADPLGLESRPAAAVAAAAVLSYLRRNQRGLIPHLEWPRLYSLDEQMYLDANTRRNLELTRTLRDGKTEGTLLWVLDRTVTPIGARTLRSWLESPMRRREAIEERLDAVEELAANLAIRQEIRQILDGASDLPRLIARLACAGGNGRDLLGLGATLELLPRLQEVCAGLSADYLVRLRERLKPEPALAAKITAAISPDAPTTIKDGGIFREGYHAELDEIRQAAREGREWVAALEARERERTGIRSLKVGFNQVFGYYIEVTKANLGLVPPDYLRRQTLANAERFVNEELKEIELKILGADERARSLEYELFQDLRREVTAATRRLQEIGSALGELDALLSLAEVGVRNGYCRPRIATDGKLELKAARHPVVEQCLPGGTFVPNDCTLDPAGVRVQILTGPNMSGKSTYLRQTALIVLMAQIGSFVPAETAVVPLVDRIFTRIGAADDLAGGRSTFLVEMTETAEILRAATDASLLILDEVGRGTGTLDGQAIARAVLEYIHDRIRAKALFATHFHGLTALSEGRPGMANYNIAVLREGDEIRFCHRLQPGAADRSYGIEVARLAGLPPAVLSRARELQMEMEAASRADGRPPGIYSPVRQIPLFPERDEGIIREMAALDLENMSPLEALRWLAEAQKRLRKTGSTRRAKSHGG